MKNLIIFVLGLVAWVFLCYKFGYDYLTEQVSTNVIAIVDQVMTNGVGTGSQNLANQYQWQAQQLLDEQKIKLKEEIKRQLTDYINKKIDDTIN